MSLVYGVVLSAASVFLFAWGFAQHRRAAPARWTRYAPLSSAFVILIVSLVPGAAGALTMAAADPAAVVSTMTTWGFVLMLASVIVTFWATPRFIREGRTGGADVVRFPVAPGGAPVAPKGMKRAA